MKMTITYRNEIHEIVPGGKVFRIGQNLSNDLTLDFSYVSGSHGIIFWDKNRFLYKDEDSTNGTWLKTSDTLPVRIDQVPLPDAGVLCVGSLDQGPQLAFSIARQPLFETDEPGRNLSRGRACLAAGEYEKALTLFDAVIDQEPGNMSAYYYAGFAASKRKQYDHAIMRFEQYLTNRQEDAGIMADLGWLYEQTGRIEKAASWYRKAIHKSNDAQARQYLNNLSRFRHPVSGNTRDLLISREPNQIQTDHFRIFFNIQEHMDRIKPVLKYFEMAYQDMGSVWHIYPVPKDNRSRDRIEVTLSAADKTDHGRTRRKKIFLYLTPDGHVGDKFLEILVRHEYAHYTLGWVTQFSSAVPWWIHEGFAQFVSQNIVKARLDTIRELMREDLLLPLEALEKDFGRSGIHKLEQVAYLQAHAGVACFIQTYGKDAFMALVGQIQSTGSTAGAFERTGLDYKRFERLFADWLMQGAGKGDIRMTRQLGNFNHDT